GGGWLAGEHGALTDRDPRAPQAQLAPRAPRSARALRDRRPLDLPTLQHLESVIELRVVSQLALLDVGRDHLGRVGVGAVRVRVAVGGAIFARVLKMSRKVGFAQQPPRDVALPSPPAL